MRYDYDMLGSPLHFASMDAGERWMLSDVAGKPLYGWDSREHRLRTVYEVLRRPTAIYLQEGNAPELLVGKTVYGEDQPNPDASNLRGKPYQAFDGAGVATTDDYDFKNNLLSSSRQLAIDYKKTLDWSVTVALQAELFTTSMSFDALNRPVQLIAPRSDQPGAKRNVIQPAYNEANLLERVDVWLDYLSEPAALLDAATVSPSAVGVSNIDYDAKGQRLRIDYKNGTATYNTYDPETFRLVHRLTQRDVVAFPDDCPQLPPAGWPGCQVQNLYYTYDPAGNITHIQDEAQQTIYFRNARVEPSAEYTYDAIYQLIEATGRENIGQVSQPETTWSDEFRVDLPHPGDGQAMRPYSEQYTYDAVGNIVQMIHQASNGNWTRAYSYHEASRIEPDKFSNRLSSTRIGSKPLEPYTYDAHGSMTTMPHLTLMQWNFRDQLSATSRQVVNATPPPDKVPETTYYVYDGGGQRARKVTERTAAANQTARMNERIYLSGFEIYREYGGDGSTVSLERETLHLMDGQQRVALVETRTAGDDGSPEQLVRYQFGNHLGSASLELDGVGRVISYEEYYGYGSASFQAVDKTIRAAAKRYRYTGMERDEETGLAYHGARYYAAWLGRWCSVDPLGARTPGKSIYESFANNPLSFVDPDGRQPKPGLSIENMHLRIEEINIALDKGVSEEEARALGAELELYKLVDSMDKLVSMTAEDWANILGNVEFSDLNPGRLMEAWATSTVEEAAPAFLSENPQERELARGALWMDAGLWSIGALADAGPATKLAKLLPDAPEVGGVRAAAREVGEGIAKTGNPLPPDFIDNLADRPGSFNPNVAKTKLLDAAEEDYTLLQRSHLGREPFTPTSSPEITLSGHGVWEKDLGYTIVPENTWVNRFGPLDETLSNTEANLVEQGWLDPVWTYGPGDVIPNMRLLPPADRISYLKLAGDPIFLNEMHQEGLLLSEILKPGMGPVNWAACTRVR